MEGGGEIEEGMEGAGE